MRKPVRTWLKNGQMTPDHHVWNHAGNPNAWSNLNCTELSWFRLIKLKISCASTGQFWPIPHKQPCLRNRPRCFMSEGTWLLHAISGLRGRIECDRLSSVWLKKSLPNRARMNLEAEYAVRWAGCWTITYSKKSQISEFWRSCWLLFSEEWGVVAPDGILLFV